MEDRNKCLRDFNMTDASDRLLRVAKMSFWLYVGIIVALLGAFLFMFIGLSADVGSSSINNTGLTIAIVAVFAVAIMWITLSFYLGWEFFNVITRYDI